MADPSLTDRPWARSDIRRLLRKWMLFWWLVMPYVMFAPAWNAVHQRPDEHGQWFGFGLVACFVMPLWLYAGWIGWRFNRVLRELETIDEVNERAIHAKKVIDIRRADRIERAEIRLARMHQDEIDAEQAAMQADLVRLAEDLSDQDAGTADN